MNNYLSNKAIKSFFGNQEISYKYGFLPIQTLIIGGGGAGGDTASSGAGGGGAGGYLEANLILKQGLNNIVVGNGGLAQFPSARFPGGDNGENSTAFGLTAIGGGGGGAWYDNDFANGLTGGSGGGAGHAQQTTQSPVSTARGEGTSGQGFRGGLAAGTSVSKGGGGGGGASQEGTSIVLVGGNPVTPGNGGNGKTWFDGITRAGGGGGSGGSSTGATTGGTGGTGGGGSGANFSSGGNDGGVGTPNTGGGGGGNVDRSGVNGGAGGSGIVIVRYFGKPVATGGTIVELNGFTYHYFNSNGTFTF